MKGHVGDVTSITFSQDGDFFASGGIDRQILMWKSNFCKDDKPSKITRQLISSSSKQEFDNINKKSFANNDKQKEDVQEEHQEEVINGYANILSYRT